MINARDIDGDWRLVGVTAAGNPVGGVDGRLILSASGPGTGTFVSVSASPEGEQEESGTFQLDGDLLLATVLESTQPSMEGLVLLLRCRLESGRLVLQYEDRGGQRGDLVQYWERGEENDDKALD